MTFPLSPDTGFAALLGVGVGIGLLLLAIGWRGTEKDRPRLHRQRHNRRVAIRLSAAIAVGVLTGLATGWFVGAILAGLACWALPRVLGSDPEHTRRVARIEAIATWSEMLRDTLSAASGLEQAILATAPLAPLPIRGEITALAARLENGERLAPSLRRVADQFADPTGDLVIAALVKAAEQQAKQLSELLGALARTARDQASMRLRVEVGRARTRTSVRMIVGTTLTFAMAVVMLNRSYMAAYDSLTGQLVLLGVGLLFAAGFAWLIGISRVPEPARFFSIGSTPTDNDRRQV
ncbi:type II secretion system F family protein [Kibdelosporangium philippinense]|uniref:Type II secretion system F family protein n=1 Tax=Kibdelosporangium philippinense TaxID=211113 RepID=A0ABS8ZTK5_9PSEU|nr:type II secretion system F family protein [Kibdelosporangium philippinense]MCE7009941.1 type II secretion system F family protein [Kibdelosporangium philippinense]